MITYLLKEKTRYVDYAELFFSLVKIYLLLIIMLYSVLILADKQERVQMVYKNIMGEIFKIEKIHLKI